MNVIKAVLPCLLLACLSSPSAAQKFQGGKQAEKRDRLYTVPDPDAHGGIDGRVTHPSKPIEKVLALPYDDPARVYEGQVTGANKSSFRFSGLPMDRYGLIVIYDDAMYEGLTLSLDDTTLTADDRKGINDVIQRSEAFFSHKIIHRLEGTTGRGGDARAICTFYRDTPAEAYMFETRTGYRRTFKLVVLKQVGPGWQIARTRDLHPIWITPDKMTVKHRFKSELSGLRVTDSIKDLGNLMLGD